MTNYTFNNEYIECAVFDNQSSDWVNGAEPISAARYKIPLLRAEFYYYASSPVSTELYDAVRAAEGALDVSQIGEILSANQALSALRKDGTCAGVGITTNREFSFDSDNTQRLGGLSSSWTGVYIVFVHVAETGYIYIGHMTATPAALFLPYTNGTPLYTDIEIGGAEAYTYDRTAFLSGMAMGLTGKGDPISGMAVSGGGASGTMLYNGVELPDINEVWTDKSKYPNAVIGFFSGAVSLVVSASKFVYYNGSSVTTSTVGAGIIFTLNGNSWTVNIAMESVPAYYAMLSNTTWCSSDILVDGSSTVYLAASAPVPVEDIFVKGYLVGAALRRKRVIPEVKETATMLYNEVELPNINTVWTDKETYLYACIRILNSEYELLLLKSTPNASAIGMNMNSGPGYAYYGLGENEWVYGGESSGGVAINSDSGNPQIIWSSIDIKDGNGVLKFAASEPVPV